MMTLLVTQAQQVPKELQDALGPAIAVPLWIATLATVCFYGFNVALRLRGARSHEGYPANGANGTGEWRGRIESTIESVSAALNRLTDNQSNVVRILERSTETLDRLATQLDRHDRQAAAATDLVKASISQQHFEHEDARKQWQEIAAKLDAIDGVLAKRSAL